MRREGEREKEIEGEGRRGVGGDERGRGREIDLSVDHEIKLKSPSLMSRWLSLYFPLPNLNMDTKKEKVSSQR